LLDNGVNVSQPLYNGVPEGRVDLVEFVLRERETERDRERERE